MQRLTRITLAGLLACVMAGLFARPGSAQGVSLTDRGPRFLHAASPGGVPVEIDASRSAVLRQIVTLNLGEPTVGTLLDAIERQTGLKFVYSRAVVQVDKPVTLRADSITLGAALMEILIDSGVDVLLSSSRQVALVRRTSLQPRERAGVVTGTITDRGTGTPIEAATVSLDGTRHRATTNAEGRYRIVEVVPGTYTVSARRIGYGKESRSVTVGDGAEVVADFALETIPTQLDEVVTTVTGEQRLRELGHVVGRINADSLVKEAPVSSLSELLNGRVPGLQVFQSQGTVGGEVHLQVRGPNTMLLNTEPIVIVDGVRYTMAQSVDHALFGVERTSRLNDLNPNDIESIEVVKGPSAATLYGTDAANGVVVVTTKRGRPGPARWNLYAKGTTTEIPEQRYPDLYWGWGTVFGVPDNTTWSCSLWYLALGLCSQQDSVTVRPNPLNDPQFTLFDNKPRWEYGANVAGGRQDLRYYFSGDFEDATGPVQLPQAIAEQLRQQRGLSELPEEWREPNAFTKLNLRANVTAVFGETADLRVNTSYIHSATRSLIGSQRSPYSVGAVSGGPTPYGQSTGNPAEVLLATSTERTDRFVGSASGQWRPAAWLTTRATVGLDLVGSNRYSLARRGDIPSDGYFSDGLVADERARQLATTAELGATATLRRGRLSARTAVGAQYVRTFSDALQTSGSDLPPGGTSVGEATTVFSQQVYAETVTLGSYLEETLGWNERLFITGALRVDGASAFGQDYDAAVYPKVSASWLLSEEPFVPRLPGLVELRLRYAYGASGQQATSAMARPEFSPDPSVENGAATTAMRLWGVGNPDLRPERVREHEFGLDATALAGRLRLGLTWYRRRTADQVVRVELPPGLGVSFMHTNLGLTTQHGFEAELTARVLDTRPVSWDLTLQHGLHRTMLVDIGNGFAVENPQGGYVEGYSLGARFQRPLLGYTDANGDNIITFDEVQVGDAAVYVGESTPPRSQTLTTVLGLLDRRLRLSALLERRSGFTQVNALKTAQCFAGACQAIVDRSTPLVEQARSIGMFLMDGTPPERGDFTRLREVTAALDLPPELARALRLRSATLALSVRNLALWTDFSGPDPESATVGSWTAVSGGMADGIPQGRSWALRLDLGL